MRRFIGLILGAVLGVSSSQFPEFSQQYEQRLGGAVDELATIVANFDTAAEQAGLSRNEALERYEVNTDDFIVGQGRDMRNVIDRYQRLNTHLIALRNAGAVEEVFSFAQYYDPEIAQRAWESYEPAVPVTPEGLAFAGVGLLAGYGMISAGTYPFRRRRRRRLRV